MNRLILASLLLFGSQPISCMGNPLNNFAEDLAWGAVGIAGLSFGLGLAARWSRTKGLPSENRPSVDNALAKNLFARSLSTANPRIKLAAAAIGGTALFAAGTLFGQNYKK